MRYEIIHDTIAKQAFEKASTDARARRKVEKLIFDRFQRYQERKALLSREDLRDINPLINAVNIPDDQAVFVQKSQRVRRGQLIGLISGVTLLIIGLSWLSIWALDQQRFALGQFKVSESRRLATLAPTLIDDNYHTALLASVEAFQRDENPDTRNALVEVLAPSNPLLATLEPTGESIAAGIIKFGAEWVSVDEAGIHFWDASERSIQETIPFDRELDISFATLSGGYAPYFALLSRDGTVRIWDLLTRTEIAGLTLPDDDIVDMVFFPNSSDLLVQHAQGLVQKWGSQSHQDLFELPDQSLEYTSLGLSADGQYVIVGDESSYFDIWDLNQSPAPDPIFSGRTPGNQSITSLALNDGLMAAAVFDQVYLMRPFDYEGPDQLVMDIDAISLDGHDEWVSSVAIRPDGQLIASGDEDGYIYLWDPEGNRIGQLLGHSRDAILYMAFTPDGRYMYSVAEDAVPYIWDLRHLTPFVGTEEALDFVLSPANFELAMAIPGQLVEVIDLASGFGAYTSTRSDGLFFDYMRFSPNGQKLAVIMLSMGSQAVVEITDLPTDEIVSLTNIDGDVADFRFSYDGKMAMVGTDRGVLQIWDLETLEVVVEGLAGRGTSVPAVAFSPDGTEVFYASVGAINRQRIDGFREFDGEPFASFAGNLPFHIHSTGTHITTVDNNTAYTLDLANPALDQNEETTARWSDEEITSFAVSPDDQLLAMGYGDGSIVLWHITTNLPTALFEGDDSAITRIGFSADSKVVFAKSENGPIRQWNADYLPIEQRACQLVKRDLESWEAKTLDILLPEDPAFATCAWLMEWPVESE